MDLLTPTYAAVSAAVSDLDDPGFARPTLIGAWTVRDLLFHQLLDPQRALVALASPAAGPADVDAVTYWDSFHPDRRDDDDADHAAYVRRAAAAYAGPGGLVEQWRETSTAAARAVAAADADARVRTQGHTISVADLASTLVVEATVHLLDLDLPVAPPAAALAHTRGVVEAAYGGPLPGTWDDREAVLRATGRLPADDPRLPVLG